MNTREKVTYLHIHNSFYINKDTNILLVIVYLLFGAKSLFFMDRINRFTFINSVVPLVRTIRVFYTAFIFYNVKRKEMKNSNSSASISIETKGHCLIALRQGEYKVIDLRKNKVVTIFPQALKVPVIKKRVTNLIESQSCVLAPEVLSWDLNKRYIVENYINYRVPTYQKIKSKKFCLEVFPVLLNIMTSKDSETTSSQAYIQYLIRNIYKSINNYSKKHQDEADRIMNFVSFLKRNYDFQTHQNVQLVFSHGDLSDMNILRGRNNTKIIDWSTVGKRSCFFDYYFLLFVRVLRSTEGDMRKYLLREIPEEISNFNKYLEDKLQWKIDPSTIHYYRCIFYLEFFKLRLEEYEESNEEPKGINTWIDMFERCESKECAEAHA